MCEEVTATLFPFNKLPPFVAVWIYSNAADLGLFVSTLLNVAWLQSLLIDVILSLPVDLGAGNVGLRLGEEAGRE